MEGLEELLQRIGEERLRKCGTTQTPEGSLQGSEVCPVCQDTGWETYWKDGYEYARECCCGIRQRRIMENRLAFASIPEAFRNIRLSSFCLSAYQKPESRERASQACKAVKYWLDHLEEMAERGMGLYFSSATKGSGKTRMAVSLANELLYERKMQVKFATSLQILKEIKESWDRKEQGEGQLLDDLSAVDVLVIDDFGTEQGKDWIGEKFYQIINCRYVDKKITIFTSNTRLDLLPYDERITNRVKERTFQIPFAEESVREQIARENMRELLEGIR